MTYYTIRVQYGRAAPVYLPRNWNNTPPERTCRTPTCHCLWRPVDLGFQVALLPLVDLTGVELREIVIQGITDAEATQLVRLVSSSGSLGEGDSEGDRPAGEAEQPAPTGR